MASRAPKISVIMPIRDRSVFVASAVESILSQTCQDFELLIINDYSEEDIFAVLTPYAQRDPRIRLLNNEDEPGISSALNTGLHRARGEYVARHDSDDISLSSRLYRQLTFLNNNPSILDRRFVYSKNHARGQSEGASSRTGKSRSGALP
jgi:glycosyltransferase involved in cell wall biosynthesis